MLSSQPWLTCLLVKSQIDSSLQVANDDLDLQTLLPPHPEAGGMQHRAWLCSAED